MCRIGYDNNMTQRLIYMWKIKGLTLWWIHKENGVENYVEQKDEVCEERWSEFTEQKTETNMFQKGKSSFSIEGSECTVYMCEPHIN